MRKPKGCGRILGFEGIITKEEKDFLKWCCKTTEFLHTHKRSLFKIKNKVERENNKCEHIISIIEKIELVHLQ